MDPPTQTPAEAPNLLPVVLPKPVTNEVTVAVMLATVVDVVVVDEALGSDAARVAIEMPRRKRRIRRMHIIAMSEGEYHATEGLQQKKSELLPRKP